VFNNQRSMTSASNRIFLLRLSPAPKPEQGKGNCDNGKSEDKLRKTGY